MFTDHTWKSLTPEEAVGLKVGDYVNYHGKFSNGTPLRVRVTKVRDGGGGYRHRDLWGK